MSLEQAQPKNPYRGLPWAAAQPLLRAYWPLLLWVVVIGGFQLWNVHSYNAVWGYDGGSHIEMVRYYLKHREPPKSGYGVSNPPAYYVIAAVLLSLYDSTKALQYLSLILYGISVALLARMLSREARSVWVVLGMATLFALLPPHLNYSIMVFNYSLGTFLAILSLYLMRSFVVRDHPSLRWVALAALTTTLGLLTALSNLFLVPAGLVAAVLGGQRLRNKALGAVLFASLVVMLMFPYYKYKQKGFDCFFCTSHRSETAAPWREVYPPSFYYHWSFDSFAKPFYPNAIQDGMWPILYHTIFGDYFGYLVPRRLSEETVDRKGLANTGRHWVDPDRARKLTRLAWAAFPVSLMLVAAGLGQAWQAVRWLGGSRTVYTKQGVLALTACVASFCQFMLYILRYPNYVNIHGGYLFPCLFVLCLSLANMIRGRVVTAISVTCLLGYCAMAYWTFLLV